MYKLLRNDYMETSIDYDIADQMFVPSSVSKQLNYDMLHERIMEQKRLISEGKMAKQSMIVGFSAEGQAAFDRGVTLNDILKKYNINA